MSKSDLRTMIEVGSYYAERAFAMHGGILPIWHAVTARGEHFITPAPDCDKDIVAALMRAAFEVHDVVRYVVVDEAWIVEARGDEVKAVETWIAEHDDLSEYPDRIEVVMLAGEDADAGQMTAHRRIIRGHGRPRLGPLEIDESIGVQSEGRLVGMLPRRSATVQ